MNTQSILEQMILVVVNINYWQGRKPLQSRDLATVGIDIDKLPSGTVKTLETMMTITPDALKVFHALKRETIALCLKHGLQFGGDGYLMPKEKVDELCRELNRIKGEFETTKAGFLSQYDKSVTKWLGSVPAKQVSVLRALVDASRHIHQSIGFSFAALEVKAVTGISDKGVDCEVANLYGQLCREVREDARCAYEYYFVGREEITRKTLRPIKAIREKLAGLPFLHPAIAETVQTIDDTLNRLPRYGAIEGDDLDMVSALVGRQLATMGSSVQQKPEAVGERGEDGEHKIVQEKIVIPEHTGKVAPIAWDF